MTHDNTGAVIPKFKQIGATAIADSAQPVFAIDHDIQNVTPKNLEKYANIEKFAREHDIDFYPAGTGISHQVMVEQGYVVPGALVVASDSHSNLYGGVAALGTPVVTLFGPTDPARSAPRGRAVALTHPVPCAPCFYRVCPIEHPCLRGLPAKRVRDAVLALLESGLSPRAVRSYE